ncbi:MAG: Binding-prot-dependent transport system rane comp, N-term, partial [Acidobacteriota bacterium]
MGRYLARRIAFACVLVFVVSSAALLLTRLAPGDFAAVEGFELNSEQREQLRARYALDQSFATQYLS